MPLAAVARAMADPAVERPASRRRRIVVACAAHPLMLAGTDTFNSTVLAETGPRALIKGGAEGVYTAALPELGQVCASRPTTAPYAPPRWRWARFFNISVFWTPPPRIVWRLI